MKTKILFIGIIVLFLVVGCDKKEPDRIVEDCDECEQNEECWFRTNGSNVCVSDESLKDLLESRQDMEHYKCHSGCYGFQGSEEVLKKVCECVNENNVSYTFDFVCGRIGSCFLTFEDKKKMAMIDDHWYCVCNETVEIFYCKEHYNQETQCKNTEYGEETINRTTEFVWKY